MDATLKSLAKELHDLHKNFEEKLLTHRRFKHVDLLRISEKFSFEKTEIGKSFEGRSINKFKLGNGPRKILLWSQMHGNEATATMAIVDIFNFFNASETHSIKSLILDNLELHFIPMLNPDGAEQFTRRTAQGIDMNRDALSLQCPESKILKEQVFDLKPEYAFNLHDQSVRYSAGYSENQAAMAFLATAYNPETEWNSVRTKARQLISGIAEVMQEYIPNKIGRFSDEFEPRAFGDNIQKWGSSLVLIESGGYGNDIEKMYLRKLNFVAILCALAGVVKNDFENYTLEQYEAIPQNQKQLFDLKVTNLRISTIGNEDYKVDIGINLEEKNNIDSTSFSISSVIEDMGDLSGFWGIKNLDAKNGILRSFAFYPELRKKYNITNDFPEMVYPDEIASFVIDHGDKTTLIINGQIVTE